jgi:non-specific serine/threonine protein kinase
MKVAQHPNLVRLMDTWETLDHILIVIEKLDGIDLKTYTKNNNISQTFAARIVNQILSAIKYLQGYGIVHRDLNPQNIIIKDNDVRLIDFSFSKILGPNQKCDEPLGNIVIIVNPSHMLLQKYCYQDNIHSWLICGV